MTSKWSLQEAHVDWLTCTAPTGDGGPRLLDCGTELLALSREQGNNVRASNFEGYHGTISEGVFAGFRLDGTCVRLSGRMARDHWRRVVEQGRNVTRLDIALTALCAPPDPNVALDAWNNLPPPGSRNGRPSEYTIIQTRDRGQTLYCGVRSSERFGRLYDKYRESKGVWRDGSWRWECEYKGQSAKEVSAYLRAQGDSVPRIVGVLRKRFEDWGVLLPVSDPGLDWRPAPIPDLTDNETRMKWLRSSVRSSLEQLSSSYTADEIRVALGLQFQGRSEPKPGISKEATEEEIKEAMRDYYSHHPEIGGNRNGRDRPEPNNHPARARGYPVAGGDQLPQPAARRDDPEAKQRDRRRGDPSADPSFPSAHEDSA